MSGMIFSSASFAVRDSFTGHDKVLLASPKLSLPLAPEDLPHL
jgi:hypothetical protein